MTVVINHGTGTGTGTSKLSIVAAVHMPTLGIGCVQQLPWTITEDLKWFQKLTHGSSVIMGHKTWQSLPTRPLKHRTNIVITTQSNNKCWSSESDKNVRVAASYSEAIDIWCNDVELNTKPAFIIGGGKVYKQALVDPQCDTLYLSKLMFTDNKMDPCNTACFDTFFPTLGDTWQLAPPASPVVTFSHGVRVCPIHGHLTLVKGGVYVYNKMIA
jgi:dihydrofolate reductase